MALSCYVEGCDSSKAGGSSPGFHCIPKNKIAEWMGAIGRPVDTEITDQKICYKHFKKEDVEMTIGSVRVLKHNVIPSVNLPQRKSGSILGVLIPIDPTLLGLPPKAPAGKDPSVLPNGIQQTSNGGPIILVMTPPKPNADNPNTQPSACGTPLSSKEKQFRPIKEKTELTPVQPPVQAEVRKPVNNFITYAVIYDLFEIKCVIPESVNIIQLIDTLPKWKTEIVEVNQEENGLQINFFIKADSINEFNDWRYEYEEINKLTYSIRTSKKCSGRYIHYNQILLCQHNTRHFKTLDDPKDKQMTKNTNCPSKIIVKIHAIKKYYRHSHRTLGELKSRKPCEINLLATHNHDTFGTDALKYRKVSDDVRNKLMHLYNCGHTPATALKSLKMEICISESNSEEVLADRRACPDYDFCRHLYSKRFKRDYDLDDYEFLQERLRAYNEETQSNSAQMEFDEEKDFVICICTPIMKRTHKHMQEASQIIFIDSIGGFGKCGCRVLILLTRSKCGDLPLGIIIISSEKSDLISRGFELLKTIVGDDLFYSNPNGPKVFLTGTMQTEQQAVSACFPTTKHLFGISHMLQSLRRWLRKPSNGIPEELQNEYFDQFRSLMFAKNVTDAENKFEAAKSTALDYMHYFEYLEQYWNLKDLWILFYRNGWATETIDTNDYLDGAMKVLRDKVFQKVRGFKFIQLTDFMLTNFTNYYERQLVDVANDCHIQDNIFGKEIELPSQEILESIFILNDHLIMVPSETSDSIGYLVDMAALTCTCDGETKRGICKHIEWASIIVYSENYNKAVDSADFRKVCYCIATGNEPTEDFLVSLEAAAAVKKDYEAHEEVFYDYEGYGSSNEVDGPEIDSKDITVLHDHSLNDTSLEESEVPPLNNEVTVTQDEHHQVPLEYIEETVIPESAEIILENEIEAPTQYIEETNILKKLLQQNVHDASSQNEMQVVSQQDVHTKGAEFITKIIEIYNNHLEVSPHRTVESLEKLYDNLLALETFCDFESACATFGKESLCKTPESCIEHQTSSTSTKRPISPCELEHKDKRLKT